MILSKIFLLFEIAFNNDDNISTTNTSSGYNNTNTNNNNINFSPNYIVLDKIEIILNQIEIIMEINSQINNEEFFSNFFSILNKLEDLINYYISKNNWRSLKKISYILRYEKIHKLNIIDHHNRKIFNIAKKFITNECYEIRIESVKLIAILCRSKIYWEEGIKYITLEIKKNKNYYIRRLYCYFFEELIRIFSFKFLNEKGQIEEFIQLINDNNQIKSSFFKILKSIFPLIEDDKYKFKIFNKLESLRKQIYEKELIDYELIKVKLIFFLYFLIQKQNKKLDYKRL
jgi:hypothetical protein